MSDVKIVETPDQMKDILNRDGSKLVVLEFMAPWNEPSKSMEQPYKDVASSAEFRDKNVEFFKVNYDKFASMAEKLNVEAMPLFLMMKGRKVIDRVVAINEKELSDRIREVLRAHTGAASH